MTGGIECLTQKQVDAALTAFLGRAFPGFRSPAGATEYRRLMADALRAASAVQVPEKQEAFGRYSPITTS